MRATMLSINVKYGEIRVDTCRNADEFAGISVPEPANYTSVGAGVFEPMRACRRLGG
jgi:hypothetical protein